MAGKRKGPPSGEAPKEAKRKREEEKEEKDVKEEEEKLRKENVEMLESGCHLVHPSYTSLHQTKSCPRFPAAFHIPIGVENPLSLLSFEELEERFGEEVVIICPEDPSICHVGKCRQFLQVTPLWRKNSLLSMKSEIFLSTLGEWRGESSLSHPPALPERESFLVCVAPAPAFILNLLLEMLASQDSEKEVLCEELKLLSHRLDAIALASGESSSPSLHIPISRLLLLLAGSSATFLSSFQGIGDGVVDTILPSYDDKLTSALDDEADDCWPEDADKLFPTQDEMIYGQHYDWEKKARCAYKVKQWGEGMIGTRQAAAICRVIARAGRENLVRLARAPFLPSSDNNLLDQFTTFCQRLHVFSPSACHTLVQSLYAHPLGCRLVRQKWFYETYGALSPHALRILSVEENRGARARAWLYAEGSETFVFPLEEGAEISRCGGAPVKVMCSEELERRGKFLIGAIWDSLSDVAKDPSLPLMWVTGSLASATILLHPDEMLFDSFEDMVACRYFIENGKGPIVGDKVCLNCLLIPL